MLQLFSYVFVYFIPLVVERKGPDMVGVLKMDSKMDPILAGFKGNQEQTTNLGPTFPFVVGDLCKLISL